MSSTAKRLARTELFNPSKMQPFTAPKNVMPRLFAVIATVLCLSAANAAPFSFSGNWLVDLRTTTERAQKLDCGTAEFNLTQTGDRVVGSHSMATVGCGRLNGGGAETVKGVVVSGIAVLVVTSGRNGAVVMGTGTLRGDELHWQTLDEIRPGEPEGDSPLILGRGVLTRRPK